MINTVLSDYEITETCTNGSCMICPLLLRVVFTHTVTLKSTLQVAVKDNLLVFTVPL